MSLLQSFEKNNIISILSVSSSKNNIGEIENTWTEAHTNVEALLMMNRLDYNKVLDQKIKYIQTTHLCRIELWYNVENGDKIKDKDNTEYDVKFVYKVPGFGTEDHLLLYVDVLI